MEEFSLFNDGLEGITYASADTIDPASDMALMIRGLSGFSNVWHFCTAASVPLDQQPKRMMNQMRALREHPTHHTDRTWPGSITRSLRRLSERQRDRMIRAPLRRALGSVADQLTPAQWDALDLIAGRLAVFAGSRSRANASDPASLVQVANAQTYLNTAVGEAFSLNRSPFSQDKLDFPVEIARSAVGALACHIEQLVQPDLRIAPMQMALLVGDEKMTHVPKQHSAPAYYDEKLAPTILSGIEFSMRTVANNEVEANKDPYWNLINSMTAAHHMASAALYGAAYEKSLVDSSVRDTLRQLGNPPLGIIMVSLCECAMREHGRKHPIQTYSLDTVNDTNDAFMHEQLNKLAGGLQQQVTDVIAGMVGERLITLPQAKRAQLGAFMAETAARQLRLDPTVDTEEMAIINATLAKGLRYEGQQARPAPDADAPSGALLQFRPKGSK